MIKYIIRDIMNSANLESLQYLAAVRVVISVCESEDMQSMIGSFRKAFNGSPAGFLDGQWKQIRGKANRKLDQIGVPELIIDIILEKLWPISFEIFKWIFYHVEDMGIDSSSTFCWTPHLHIDYEETAIILVKNEALDLKKRFKVACFYCLEQEARSLWNIMSLSERRSFFVRGNLKKHNQKPIVLYWTYYIQEVPIDFWNCKALNCTQLFKHAMEDGYLTPTKFFFRRIKKQLRNRMIENSFYIHLLKLNNPENIVRHHLTIACYLISKLRPNYPNIWNFRMLHLIFLYFLEWPMQKHFMAVVNQMKFCYLQKKSSGDLLEGIIEKDLRGFKDYDYKKLFMEFWNQNPVLYKTYVNTESMIGFRILMKFVRKHFGFVFKENAFALKAKFRTIVLQQEFSENVAYFEKENVEFFKFLVLEQVATRSFIDRLLRNRYINFPFPEFGTPLFSVPFGELMYLIDGILRAV